MKAIYFIAFYLTPLCWPGLMVSQDKEATKVLDDLYERYDAYRTIEMDFLLTIAYPDQPIDRQEGVLIQDGKQFLFKTPQQELRGDGRSVWLYLKERNEVQINDYEEDDEGLNLVTPKDFLRQYHSGQFEYRTVDKTREQLTVEFKPNDRDSEYAKFRVTIDRRQSRIEQVVAFGKDGSTITFEVKKQTSNKDYDEATFVFDPSKYPGVLVEDLRIN